MHMHMCRYMYICICTYTHMHVSMYNTMYACVHVCMHTCTCMHDVHMHIKVSMYICHMYIHVTFVQAIGEIETHSIGKHSFVWLATNEAFFFPFPNRTENQEDRSSNNFISQSNCMLILKEKV